MNTIEQVAWTIHKEYATIRTEAWIVLALGLKYECPEGCIEFSSREACSAKEEIHDFSTYELTDKYKRWCRLAGHRIRSLRILVVNDINRSSDMPRDGNIAAPAGHWDGVRWRKSDPCQYTCNEESLDGITSREVQSAGFLRRGHVTDYILAATYWFCSDWIHKTWILVVTNQPQQHNWQIHPCMDVVMFIWESRIPFNR